MNSKRLRIAIFASTLLAVLSARGADVKVTLAPQDQTVTSGGQPRFVVTVSPIAKTQRVMRFGERSDLRDNYAELIVRREGKPVEVPRLISDLVRQATVTMFN